MSKQRGLLKGTSAFLFINYSSAIIGFVIIVVNGKLLSPIDFGLISLAMVFVSILESLKQLGFKEYLIAAKTVNIKEVTNAWTIDLLKSICLSLVLIISSDFIIDYYQEPRLNLIILIFSVIFLIEGLFSPKFYLLRKNLEYKKLIRFNLIQSMIYLVFSISLVYYYQSYIGVVYSYLIKSVSGLVLSYIYSPCKPSLYFNFEITRKQMKYGIWILASALIFYVTNRFDTFVLSTKVNLSELGYYTFAYTLANGLIAQPAKAFNNALFPLLSKGSVPYSKERIFIILLAVSIVAGLIVLFIMPYAITNFIDVKWEPAIKVALILSMSFLVNGLKFDGYFMASGKTNYKFIIELTKGIVFLLTILPLVIEYGIEGAALSTLLSNIVSLFIWIGFMNNGKVKINL